MLELAQQLSYYLSVVDGGATSKLVGFGQQLASVGMIAMTARASIQGLVQPLEQVASAWSGREQQINNITRSLRQYQYVGHSIVDINRDIARSMPGSTEAQRGAAFTRIYNQQFEEGRQAARGIIQDMNRMAAILPGEANDYMQAFSTSLPFLSQSRGMTDQRAVRLTSYLTAGGIAGGIDAGQSGRDLMQFLTTGPHITDRSWTEVWSQYATRGGRKVSAEQIRGMNTTQRVEVLENIAHQLQPMMDATGDSYEALKGTLNSFKHELYLFVTEPIFDAWKGTLRAMGLQFEGLRLTVGPVLRVFSQFAADKLMQLNTLVPSAAARISDWFMRMPDHLESLSNAVVRAQQFISPVTSAGGLLMATARSNLGAAHSYATAHLMPGGVGNNSLAVALARFFAPEIFAAVLWRVLGVALGPVGFLITTLITRIFTGGQAGSIFASLMSAVSTIFPVLLSVVGGFYRLYEGIMEVAASLVQGLIGPLLEIGGVVITGILEIVMLIGGLLGNILAGAILVLLPILYAGALGFEILFAVASAGWRMLMGLFGGVSSSSFDIIDALREATRALTSWKTELMDSVYYLMHEFYMLSDEEYQARIQHTPGSSSGPQFITDLRSRMANIFGEISTSQERRGNAPANRPQVHQDFRYSRFDITQKFAEGFSPERVAAAFTSDLEAMANQRLSSGLAPAFTSG